MWLVHLEDADGVDVGGAWFPATEEHDGRALHDVPLFLSLPNGCQEAILNINCPVLLHWLCVVEWVDPAVEVALERGRGETEVQVKLSSVLPKPKATMGFHC